jgi:hypothetical protein
VDHFEGFEGEGGGINELDVAAEFLGLDERVDDGTDAGGVDDGHGFEVEDEAVVFGGEGGLDGRVELVDGIGAFEMAFYAQGAGLAGLEYVEVHKCFTFRRDCSYRDSRSLYCSFDSEPIFVCFGCFR